MTGLTFDEYLKAKKASPDQVIGRRAGRVEEPLHRLSGKIFKKLATLADRVLAIVRFHGRA